MSKEVQFENFHKDSGRSRLRGLVNLYFNPVSISDAFALYHQQCQTTAMEVVETISITSLVQGTVHLYLPFFEYLQFYIQVQ
jgi:hypothetical protein